MKYLSDREDFETEKETSYSIPFTSSFIWGNLLTGRIRWRTIQVLYSYFPRSLDLNPQILQTQGMCRGYCGEVKGSSLKWRRLCAGEEGGGETVLSTSYLKWCPLCATLGKIKTSLPTFWSGLTLTSTGPRTHSPERQVTVQA